jgi:small subunit ribosomal protein S8
MTNYPLGDFLISVKNASLAGKAAISFPRNKLVEEVANVLKKLGYLEEIVKKDEAPLTNASGIFSARLVGAKSAEAKNSSHSSTGLRPRFSAKADKTFTAKIIYKQGKPLIMDLKLISKPGLRIYMGVAEVESKKGPSIFLLSTPRGIITSKEVKKLRVGGEVIAEIL